MEGQRSWLGQDKGQREMSFAENIPVVYGRYNCLGYNELDIRRKFWQLKRSKVICEYPGDLRWMTRENTPEVGETKVYKGMIPQVRTQD